MTQKSQYRSSLSFNMFSERDMKYLQETADAHGISVNELMRRVISEAVEDKRLGSIVHSDTDDVALLYADAIRQDGFKSGDVVRIDGVKIHTSADLTLKIDPTSQTVDLMTCRGRMKEARPKFIRNGKAPNLTSRQRKVMCKFDNGETVQAWTGRDRRTLLSLLDKSMVDIIEGTRDHLHPVFEITSWGSDVRGNFRSGKS